MLEFEKKLILSPDEYLTLKRYLSKHTADRVQTNYYYDTDDFALNKKGVTCRIREKNGTFKATVKQHGASTKECSTERSKEVINALDDSFFAGMGVKLQGFLKTERTVVYSDDYCEAVLDKNTYLGFTDYELEIEYRCDCETRASGLLCGFVKLLRLNYLKTDVAEFFERAEHSKSKSERFFRRKSLLEKEVMCNDVCYE